MTGILYPKMHQEKERDLINNNSILTIFVIASISLGWMDIVLDKIHQPSVQQTEKFPIS